MSRKLATVRKVLDIRPIEGADAIELAIIGGWQCVVKKGDFKVGDLGVYFEIDSFLPIEPKYEFLRKSSYRQLPTGEEGFRLRTVRLRGALSQGLLLPLGEFTDLPVDTYDLTSFLKVTKYEPPMPACLAGDAAGSFPSDIPKTDAERIQNLADYFEQYKEAEFEVTEKLDGCLAGFTKIKTSDGEKTIEEICRYDKNIKVVGFDPKNNKEIETNITKGSIRPNSNTWYEIELENGTVVTLTGNHRVYDPTIKTYIETEKLTTCNHVLVQE